ncbi:hypothetical protein HWV62_15615 [Athelia sp. TMB]|nr:hypothetical protein HWV62_15615 [Athelia sp. TMB]
MFSISQTSFVNLQPVLLNPCLLSLIALKPIASSKVSTGPDTAHFLMDIDDVRTDGTLVLTLPDPLPEGAEERMSVDGTKIWNPLFNIAKPLQHPANQVFIKEVVSTVIEVQKTTPTISDDVLQDKPRIEEAVKTYFTTMCNKYQRQINPEGIHAVAYNKRTRRSGDKSRRTTKYLRRVGMVSDFETKHNAKEVGLLVREELMSSEDESFGKAEEGAWTTRAARYTAKGQKALEIHRLECRSVEVSRLYYALDQLAFSGPDGVDGKKPSVKTAGQVHAQFHGFPENMNSDWPTVRVGKPAIPDYGISKKWLAKEQNTGMPMLVWTPDADHAFDIDDAEIHANDLEAMKSWADDEVES